MVVDIERQLFAYCDSFLSGDTIDAVGTTRRWLKDEVLLRLGADARTKMDIGSWRVVENEGVPAQTDGGSCGVFSLMLADCMSSGVLAAFRQEDVRVLRARLALDLALDTLVCSPSHAALYKMSH